MKMRNLVKSAGLTLAIILILSLFSGCVPGEERTMWFEHATKKILKDCEPGRLSSYTVYLAKNEYEGCQVAVRYSEYIDDFTISLGRIEGGEGDSATHLSAELNREYYIPTAKTSPFFITTPEDDMVEVDYPDAIAPFSGTMDLPNDITAPFFIVIHADAETPAGDYTVNVTAGSGTGENYKELDKLTLKIHVWDFALPESPAMAAVMDLSPGQINAKMGLSGAEGSAMYRKYYDFLLEHHVSAYSMPVDILSDEADAYMSDPRVTAFKIGSTSDDYVKAVAEKLRSNPEWLKKAYFYFLDEPNTQDAYIKLVDISNHIREIFPEARIVSPFFTDPEMYDGTDGVEYATGSVNIWCMKLFCFDSNNIYNQNQLATLKPIDERLKARRELGEDVWTYVCWEPGEPYLDLYINMTGLQNRLIFWQNHNLSANGFLYWSSNYWNSVDDPWTDGTTVKWLSHYVFGDGSVLYNGNKVGIDGPCSSLRLEHVRDGVDDYTYLEMLSEYGMSDEAIEKLVNSVTSSLTEYTDNDDLFYKNRIRVGQILENLVKKGK